MTSWWYFYYWSSYFLNWTVLPFVIGYLESGDFTIKGRSLDSLKYNAPYYAGYLVAFAALCAYLYLTKSGEETMKKGGGLVGVIIGLNLAVGLLWLALVLAYGIV